MIAQIKSDTYGTLEVLNWNAFCLYGEWHFQLICSECILYKPFHVNLFKKKKHIRKSIFFSIFTLNCSWNYLMFVCVHTKFQFSLFQNFFSAKNLLPQNRAFFCTQFPKTISCVNVYVRALLSYNGRNFFHTFYEYFKTQTNFNVHAKIFSQTLSFEREHSMR